MSRAGKRWRASFVVGFLFALFANINAPYIFFGLRDFFYSRGFCFFNSRDLATLILIVVYTCLLWFSFFTQMGGAVFEFLIPSTITMRTKAAENYERSDEEKSEIYP